MAQAIRTRTARAHPAARRHHSVAAGLLQGPRHFRGRHHAATIFVIAVLAVIAFQAFPERSVTVLNDGRATHVSATFDTRRDSLSAAEVDLQPGDQVLIAHGNRHSSVAIRRAREVLLAVDDRTLTLRTQATTVGGALAAAGVELRPGDRIFVDGHVTTERGPLTSVSLVSDPARAASARISQPDSRPVQLTIARARPVTVYIDTLKVDTATAAPTVQALLGELGMTVREGDLVRPALDSSLSAGMSVRLAKARTITVRLDGKDQTLYTQAQSVADVLRLLGVDPGPREILSHPRETAIASGMTIVIGLTREAAEEEREPIPPPTLVEYDASLPAGTDRVVPGAAGVRVVNYLVRLENGSVISRQPVTSSVLQAAVPTRIIKGTRPTSNAASQRPVLITGDSPPSTYARKLTVVATWYNATHGGKSRDDPWYGITSNGTKLDKGVCAVDPKVIPLGTAFYVPGYGNCVAADVGGGVRGDHVDLGFPESAGDNVWGTKTVEIYILN